MKIKILCFGKMDSQNFSNVLNFYQKKVNKKNDFEIIELKEFFQSDHNQNIEKNMQVLEKQLLKYTDYETFIFDVEGDSLNSLEFSKIIEKNQIFHQGKLLFVIGPSDGYDLVTVKKYRTISFGKITFPHQLFRIIVVEQIYRSLKILNHETYHK